MSTEPIKDEPNQKMKGEGSREAAQNFRKEQEAFAQSGKVEEKAREAAEALDYEE